MVRVLVTRPEPAARATASRLAELGFDPVILPLTEIHSIQVEGWSATATYDAVAATSANALRHAPPGLLAAHAHLPCYAVGSETAAAAEAAGLADVVDGPGRADLLAAQISASMPEGSRILFLCGRVRYDQFEHLLTADGFAVTAIETYDAVALDPPESSVLEACNGEPVGAVLLYSANGASRFAALARREGLGRLFSETRYFCLSPRIAENLSGLPTERICVAAAPREANLMALLSDNCGKKP